MKNVQAGSDAWDAILNWVSLAVGLGAGVATVEAPGPNVAIGIGAAGGVYGIGKWTKSTVFDPVANDIYSEFVI